MRDEIIRTQVSITNDELEILEEMTACTSRIDTIGSCYEDALTFGILNQIVRNIKKERIKWTTN